MHTIEGKKVQIVKAEPVPEPEPEEEPEPEQQDFAEDDMVGEEVGLLLSL